MCHEAAGFFPHLHTDAHDRLMIPIQTPRYHLSQITGLFQTFSVQNGAFHRAAFGQGCARTATWRRATSVDHAVSAPRPTRRLVLCGGRPAAVEQHDRPEQCDHGASTDSSDTVSVGCDPHSDSEAGSSFVSEEEEEVEVPVVAGLPPLRPSVASMRSGFAQVDRWNVQEVFARRASVMRSDGDMASQQPRSTTRQGGWCVCHVDISTRSRMNRWTPRTWRTDDCLLYRESKASVISLDLRCENQSTLRLQHRQRGARRHKGLFFFLFFLVARMSKSALSSFFRFDSRDFLKCCASASVSCFSVFFAYLSICA